MNLSSISAGVIAAILGVVLAIPVIAAGAFLFSSTEPQYSGNTSRNSVISGSIDYGSRN